MRTGRPTKLTPEIQEKIVSAIQGGNYVETAAAFAGVSKTTLYTWMRKGARAQSGKQKEFLDAVKRALAESEVNALARIAVAGEKAWQADAWRLERRFYARWGRKADPVAGSTDHDDEITTKEILEAPQWRELMSVIRGVLRNYPGSQEALHDALVRLSKSDTEPHKG